MSQKVLAIDVGNSRVKYGLFGAGSGPLPNRIESMAADITARLPWTQIVGWLPAAEWTRCRAVLAGSNPRRIAAISAAWPNSAIPPPTTISDSQLLSVDVQLNSKSQVGIDRLLTAIAANRIRCPDDAAIVIDAGTATTVDLIAPDGRFQGGAILPGLTLATRSLHDYTALLPELSRQDLARPTPSALGRNTVDAIRAGVYLGHVAAIRSLIERLSDDHCRRPPDLFLTGGAAPVLSSALSAARHEPYLALQGLIIATTS